MTGIYITFAVLAIFAGMLAFCVAGLIRNQWVYKSRMAILKTDMSIYRRMPSYDLMMSKWWIWDVRKFIDMPDYIAAKRDAKWRALGKELTDGK